MSDSAPDLDQANLDKLCAWLKEQEATHITIPRAEYEALTGAKDDIFKAEKELNSRWTSLITLRGIIYERANALRAANIQTEGEEK